MRAYELTVSTLLSFLGWHFIRTLLCTGTATFIKRLSSGYYPCKEIDAQRDEVTCLRTHKSQWPKLGIDSRSLDSLILYTSHYTTLSPILLVNTPTTALKAGWIAVKELVGFQNFSQLLSAFPQELSASWLGQAWNLG